MCSPISSDIPTTHPLYHSFTVDDNDMIGSIPMEISFLTKLNTLRLDENDMTSTLPSSIGSLSDLTSLMLSDNSFSGELPDLSNLTKLEVLTVDSNGLWGNISTFTFLGQMESLGR